MMQIIDDRLLHGLNFPYELEDIFRPSLRFPGACFILNFLRVQCLSQQEPEDGKDA